ncbi:doublecortin domain-containing protein 1-like [Apostichopus japonicus]|uniref:doublecortin domain-containing protein 1-like n=1 Tax=Stichopus japonicus TaxID=307972 RepID=UPI003AB8CC09
MSPGRDRSVRISESIATSTPFSGEKKFNRSPSDAISYEDLLVAQYLDSLQKSQPAQSKRKLHRSAAKASPYLQRVGFSDHGPSFPGKTRGTRPISAVSRTSDKKRIDMSFLAGQSKSDSKDGEEEEEGKRPVRKRPESAPVYKTKRPWSGRPWSGRSVTSAASSKRFSQSKGLYKKQPKVIRAMAFKNGLRDQGYRITAPTLKVFLEYCTLKLDLKFAARRMFLIDGTELKTAEEIPKDAEIFISCGEPFKDPVASAKGTAHKNIHAMWTLNGVQLPTDQKKKKPRNQLSRRMRKMLSSDMRRILIFCNGDGSEMHEMLASPGQFGKFLDGCTLKLGLTSPARVAYMGDGTVIETIDSIPKLDACLQSTITPVYGPVWVSKGEAFSPGGAKDFLQVTVKHCRDKEREGQKYKKQLQLALDEDFEDVTITKLLSMKQDELEFELKETENGVQQFTETRKKLKDILNEIADSASQEKEYGSTFKMQHIPEIESTHRLVGQQGLRLKVYENGRNDGEQIVFFNLKEASKGVNDNRTLIMERLLDTITRWIHLEQNTTALSTVVTTIFNSHGEPINDVFQLQNDQEIWISFGELFKDPNVYCLQLTLDRARLCNLCGERNTAIREPINIDEIPDGGERHTLWHVSEGAPEGYEMAELQHPGCYNQDELMTKNDAIQKLEDAKMNELSIDNHFLYFKDDPSKVLYSELSVQTKRKIGDREVWPRQAQSWVINKRGQIYSRAFPQMALTVLEKQPRFRKVFLDGKTEADGYAVGLEKRSSAGMLQEWSFSNDGRIFSKTYPELALTYVEERSSSDVTMVTAQGDQMGETTDADWLGMNQSESGNQPDEYSIPDNDGSDGLSSKLSQWLSESKEFKGQHIVLAAVSALPSRHPWAKSQRWALKQEKFENLGQWKHSVVTNPEWNKLAYSWPILEDESWNDEFDWPMEGYLIAYAPPLKKNKEKSSGENLLGTENEETVAPVRTAPLRLQVLKNGERDMTRSAWVVGPDLTNMMKDLNRSASNGKRFHRKTRSWDKRGGIDEEQKRVEKLETKEEKLKQLEFQLFLDRCTSLLNLPFAARRLYDHQGKEHRSLDNLERDQLVFASCGETWKDPNLSSQEQQRRVVLAMLAGDIDAIRQFCTLRDPDTLVLEVEGSLAVGSRLVVNHCPVSDEDRLQLTKPETPEEAEEEEVEIDDDLSQHLSSHQKSHLRSEQHSEGLKWPWERVVNVDLDRVTEVNQADQSDQQYSSNELYKKFKPKKRKSSNQSRLVKEQFSYYDGFITCKSNPYLVVGLENPELESSAVILCKKNTEDTSQRWEIDEENGFICSKPNPEMVLTVTMPAFKAGDDSIPTSFVGQEVALQPKRQEQNGRANQKWAFESDTGIIDAFATEVKDIEITAANKANVCTFAVVGETPVEQPGYVLMSKKSGESVTVCFACARTLRAHNKLTKLEDPTEFICFSGQTAANRGQRGMGCFQCLSGKVDLSTFEASNTVSQYEKEFTRLKQMNSARLIAKEINAYQPIQSVRLLAYRNGEGRGSEGVLMVGSTLRGLLDQCTYSLQLPSAARKLYTQDGTQVITVADVTALKLAAYGIKHIDLNNKDSVEGDVPTESRENTINQIMRLPLEVWVSCGESFIHLAQVDYMKQLKTLQRAERSKVMRELDQEKHILRQMQGRRTTGMEGPDFIATLSPQQPVLVEGGWTKPCHGEVKKYIQVNQLQNHLSEVKAHQRSRDKPVTRSIVDSSNRLYIQPTMKRILVYRNGSNPEKASHCWGASIPELLRDASLRLSLHREATLLFTEFGSRVESFSEVARDRLYCVSSGESFRGNKKANQQVEVKANFARVRKKDGVDATDITVTHNIHPTIEVDPFGPPSLALPAPP